MKYKHLILVFLCVLIFTYNATAEDKQFSVLVNIPVKNEFTDRAKSFVTREFRQLSDVKLVDRLVRKKGQFFVSIVVVPLELTNGVTAGIAVSYVFQDGDWIGHNVLTGPTDDLKSLCEKLVSTFDMKILEPYRHK